MGSAVSARVSRGYVCLDFLLVEWWYAPSAAGLPDLPRPLFVRLSSPKVCMLYIAEFAHPCEINVKRLDLGYASHQVPDFGDTIPDVDVTELRRRQASTNDQPVCTSLESFTGRTAGSGILPCKICVACDVHGGCGTPGLRGKPSLPAGMNAALAVPTASTTIRAYLMSETRSFHTRSSCSPYRLAMLLL